MFEDGAYLRGRAQLCLAMAREMSDPQAAQRLKQEAMSYTLRAERIEDGEQQVKRDVAVRDWKTAR